ncbi:UbiA family prenyltransferase [Kineosporia sp. J2-2]|uniref:UbiA family prenyltransferase n=1 Tax=Kineosporia corallincola TaxID=2835133 RepID=A0ABS5T952_9ACTN|nr:UbiA family prenyltransferase [Kineosporia corallincola]MBT0767580.1 UbiA family prenyltransferase [Kineosporia corallincola]
MGSSVLAYMAGMALNDYADRRVDAVERPHRPIPSGRISPRRALAIGAGLLAADLALAGVVRGRRGVVLSLATGSSLLAYDFVTKGTAAGPATMALCRFLDVQRGSSSFRAALLPASVVAAHTYMITEVSRAEVEGGDRRVAVVSGGVTTALAGLVLALALRSDDAGRVAGSRVAGSRVAGLRVAGLRVAGARVGGSQAAELRAAGSRATGARAAASLPAASLPAASPPAGSPPGASPSPPAGKALVAALAAALYAVPSVRSSFVAARSPTPKNLQSLVRTGVLGMVPLQGALTAAAGRPAAGAALLAMWRVGRAIAVRGRVT